MPVLIALGATVRLRHGESERVIPLEDLYLGYQKKSLAPGELVVSVLLPLPSADDPVKVATYKISKRYEQDISAVCAAFAMRVQAGVVVDARICFGGVGPTPMRARRVEAALIGQPFSEVVCEAARRHFSEDFQPISDMRASAAYRQTVASNLLRRFYLEISGQGMPLMVHSLQLHTA
jgi:xanthine dehydrogenase small subunit